MNRTLFLENKFSTQIEDSGTWLEDDPNLIKEDEIIIISSFKLIKECEEELEIELEDKRIRRERRLFNLYINIISFQKNLKIYESDSCPICLNDWDIVDKNIIKNCGHTVCKKCIKEMIRLHHLNCPLCKQPWS